MGILRNKNTRVIISIMVALVIVSLIVSKLYYQNINDSVDPRIKEARILYEDYNKYAEANNFSEIFILLDSIEKIYKKYPHYDNSFEMGVLENNKAAVYITLALHKDSIALNENSQDLPDISKDSLLRTGLIHLESAIDIYKNWQDKFAGLSKEKVKEKIKPEFYRGLEDFSQDEKENFLHSRLEIFMENQVEINRRLSVSYTNLGVIYRHMEKYDEAVEAYAEAIELWDRNITAENNLNLLLDRPMKKRNIIQKLFPPDRNVN